MPLPENIAIAAILLSLGLLGGWVIGGQEELGNLVYLGTLAAK
ncbi:hypothetical protein [Nostoc mirabile]|nr:hypothetical protein [Nostoc mirabile]